MNLLNRVSLLVGGFAATLCLPGLVLISKPVLANPTNSSTATMTAPNSSSALMQSLNLTPRQKEQIGAIHSRRNQAIKQVLSTQQYSQLASSLKSGRTLRESFQSLNPPLNANQQKRIGGILSDSSKKVWQTLTPKQQQTLKTAVQNMRSGSPIDQ